MWDLPYLKKKTSSKGVELAFKKNKQQSFWAAGRRVLPAVTPRPRARSQPAQRSVASRRGVNPPRHGRSTLPMAGQPAPMSSVVPQEVPVCINTCIRDLITITKSHRSSTPSKALIALVRLVDGFGTCSTKYASVPGASLL